MVRNLLSRGKRRGAQEVRSSPPRHFLRLLNFSVFQIYLLIESRPSQRVFVGESQTGTEEEPACVLIKTVAVVNKTGSGRSERSCNPIWIPLEPVDREGGEDGPDRTNTLLLPVVVSSSPFPPQSSQI